MAIDEQDLPVQCQLDRQRLTKMEAKLDLILVNQAEFVSIDGPLSRVRDHVTAVDGKADSAHRRLDVHDDEIHSLSDRQWQIVWKVLGGVGAAGAAAAVIAKAVGAL